MKLPGTKLEADPKIIEDLAIALETPFESQAQLGFLAFDIGLNHQRIQQVLAYHLLDIAYRGEVEGLVPARDELDIVNQFLLYRYRVVQAHVLKAVFKLLA